MINRTTRRRIDRLLTDLGAPKTCLDFWSLYGYLYAIVITPELIYPQEWLQGIFASEDFPFTSQAQADAFFDEVIALYNTLNQQRLDNTLSYPFDFKDLEKPDRLTEIANWTIGFRLGLDLRHDIWFAAEQRLDPDRKVLAALSAVELVCSDPAADPDYPTYRQRFDEYMLKMLQKQSDSDIPQDLSDDQCFSFAVLILPVAVQLLQNYAAEQEATLAHDEPLHQHDPDGTCCGPAHEPPASN